jgi:hypothetical protein
VRDYAKVCPKFWTGQTCKDVRARGSEGALVALYLMTSPMSNMLGLFNQPLLYMAHETGLGLEGASKGLQACIDAKFCKYDQASETVWVIEMAAYQIASELKASDNRCAGIQKDYDGLSDNPFLGEFFDRYQRAFHLSNRRGWKGASKPLPSQEQEQEQEQEQDLLPPNPPADAGGQDGTRKGRKTRAPSESITFAAFVQACREAGQKPIPADDPIFKFADDANIPRDFLRLAWRAFGHKHRTGRKRQKGLVGWRAHFRDAVRGNWAKVWYFPSEGQAAALTTVGIGLKREMEAEAAAAAPQDNGTEQAA